MSTPDKKPTPDKKSTPFSRRRRASDKPTPDKPTSGKPTSDKPTSDKPTPPSLKKPSSDFLDRYKKGKKKLFSGEGTPEKANEAEAAPVGGEEVRRRCTTTPHAAAHTGSQLSSTRRTFCLSSPLIVANAGATGRHGDQAQVLTG